MNRLAPFESGQGLEGFSSLLFSDSQVLAVLKIQPELRTGGEEMSKAQSGIAGEGASAVQDLRDAIRGPAHPARQIAAFTRYVKRSECGEFTL
jgi:hypothetical protein